MTKRVTLIALKSNKPHDWYAIHDHAKPNQSSYCYLQSTGYLLVLDRPALAPPIRGARIIVPSLLPSVVALYGSRCLVAMKSELPEMRRTSKDYSYRPSILEIV